MKLIVITTLFLLLVNLSFSQQRLPFSEKEVDVDGRVFLPYTKGEVVRKISGAQKPVLDKICSIITAWDSIVSPQGMKVFCFGYDNSLEIYFLPYLFEDGVRFASEGGPNLSISVNDPLKIVGFSVAPGIYICPQKTADFYGYPIYEKGTGGEVTIVTNTKVPLYVPVSQEEYLRALIEETTKKTSPLPDKGDYQKQLQEMEKNYQELRKLDEETAKEVRKAIDELRKEMNQNNGGNLSSTDPVSMLKNKLSAMTEEERKRDAYYRGEDFSGLMPYAQRKYGDALVRINPVFIEEISKPGIQLLVISWSLSSDNMNEDKPRFYDKGRKGFHIADNLMKELYKSPKIWNNVFDICK